MNDIAIKVQNLSKKYALGAVHTNLLSERLGTGLRSLYHKFRSPNSSPQSAGLSPLTLHDPPGKDFWALRDVSFEVNQGEVLGIIGRNGAGKSTLLKILSRITSPTSGRVEIDGRVASLLEVGTGFHPELTGRENIFLNGAILGMTKSEIRRKFDEIVAFAEVEQFIDTPVKRYSSGMYVRLAFAVAAHLEPEILIVDEVLAVGDASFQRKCLGKMESVAKGGRTVLFVSHNMASIKRLCSSVVLLAYGQIAEKGNPGPVIAGYLRENMTENAVVFLSEDQHLTKSCLQIKTVEVLNSRQQPSSVMFSDEDIYIRLGLQSTEPVKKVRVGIGVCTEGIRLATLHTPPSDFQGSHEIQNIICKIGGKTLLPNFYTLDLGAHSIESGRTLDWIADATSFNIAEVTDSPNEDLDEKESGLIRLSAQWEGKTL